MVIHHDKMAYGRLDSLRQDVNEEKLAAIAKLLSQTGEEGEKPLSPAEGAGADAAADAARKPGKQKE